LQNKIAEAKPTDLPRDLGDGLILRRATPADRENLAEFNRIMHEENGQPDDAVGYWTQDLLKGDHPTTKPEDFTIVVDQNQGGKIVSSIGLISQTWAFDGIVFGAGRPELVATDPASRRKGLIKLQMDLAHARSAERGEMVQFITGIPWYYRQFGYEMGLHLSGARRLPLYKIGKLPAGQTEAYRLRPATFEDIPLLARLYEIHCRASLVTRVRNEAVWRYEISGQDARSVYYHNFRIVEEVSSGEAIGYLETSLFAGPGALAVRELAVLPGNSMRAVCEFLVRALKAEIEELNKERKEPLASLSFAMGATAHPCYAALDPQLDRPIPPYATYIRVPDLPGFIRHIAPVLERRLAGSVVEGHTGTLRLNFYRSNMTLVFERGQLKEIGTYQPKRLEEGDATFPDLTFLQLLFGYRSMAELNFARADCGARNDTSRVLLDALFPPRASNVVTLG
jgi:predicted N-acetyltransferase YhbS